jgi:membrane-associated protein
MLSHFFHIIIELLTNLEPMMRSFVADHQSRTYILLFAIIFIETGLIFFPFLPGDSLLFVVGSIAAGVAASLNIWFVIPLLIIAALL